MVIDGGSRADTLPPHCHSAARAHKARVHAPSQRSVFEVSTLVCCQVKDLEVTTDRWAEPVATDDPLMAKLRPLLAGERPRHRAVLCQQLQAARCNAAVLATTTATTMQQRTAAPPSSRTGTQLESEALRCAFSATEDGWDARAFHDRVDGYGAALVVCRTAGGAVCGGYNPVSGTRRAAP